MSIFLVYILLLGMFILMIYFYRKLSNKYNDLIGLMWQILDSTEADKKELKKGLDSIKKKM